LFELSEPLFKTCNKNDKTRMFSVGVQSPRTGKISRSRPAHHLSLFLIWVSLSDFLCNGAVGTPEAPYPSSSPPPSDGSYTIHKLQYGSLWDGNGEWFPKDRECTPRVVFSSLGWGGAILGPMGNDYPRQQCALGVIKSPWGGFWFPRMGSPPPTI